MGDLRDLPTEAPGPQLRAAAPSSALDDDLEENLGDAEEPLALKHRQPDEPSVK